MSQDGKLSQKILFEPPKEAVKMLNGGFLTDCRPRTQAGACPWLPNGGSQKRETCLTATDNRPQFAGQECVWCEKDCEGKHQCEVRSRAQPIANYVDCSPKGINCTSKSAIMKK